MVTREQAKMVKEYLDLWQMHSLDGSRLAKLKDVNLAVKAGTPRHREFMELLGLDADKDKQTSEKIVEREMQLAQERRILYYDEIGGIHNQLTEMGLDINVKKILDSLHVKVIENHKENIMTEEAMGINEAATLNSIVRDQL